MAHATNPIDGRRIYYEDTGGEGSPVVLLGGFLDSVADALASNIAQALPRGEFRLVAVDHRGLGQSDKPHDPTAYAMWLRVSDVLAVLDTIGIARAHVAGMSWGGRLAFGVGALAPGRVRSVVVLGQQPYAWPDSPLTRAVTEGLVRSRTEGIEALIASLESAWGVTFPVDRRRRWLANDAAALDAAWTTALTEGAIADDLAAWRTPCLICIGSADADFYDLAQRAANEIPGGEFLPLAAADHYQAHVSEDEILRAGLLAFLRRVDG